MLRHDRYFDHARVITRLIVSGRPVSIHGIPLTGNFVPFTEKDLHFPSETQVFHNGLTVCESPQHRDWTAMNVVPGRSGPAEQERQARW